MAKNAVENYNQIKENGINPPKDYAFDNLKLFFSGVGEYFIPVAFALFLYIIILSLFLYGIYLTGNHLIGGFPITYSQLKLISTNTVSYLCRHTYFIHTQQCFITRHYFIGQKIVLKHFLKALSLHFVI